jgi:hypothetical protein
MKTEIKIYKIKNFVRKTVSGEIDMNKSMSLVKQFADIAYLHPDHNILIDMRDTEVTSTSITDLMKISLELANSLPDFKNKIANVIPFNEERMRISRQFHSCMLLKGFSYETFTDFEKAIEWLSDTNVIT